MNVPDGFITTKPVSKRTHIPISPPRPDFSPTTSTKPKSVTRKAGPMIMPTADFFNDPPPPAKRRRVVSTPIKEQLDPKLVVQAEGSGSGRKERRMRVVTAPLRPFNPPEVTTPQKPRQSFATPTRVPVTPAVHSEDGARKRRPMRVVTTPLSSSTPFKSRQPPPPPIAGPSETPSRLFKGLHPPETPRKPLSAAIKARPPPSLPHKPKSTSSLVTLPPPPLVAADAEDGRHKKALLQTFFAHASDADVSSIMLQDMDRLREDELDVDEIGVGLQISPRKPKFRDSLIRGGLASQADQFLSQAYTARVLWDRELALSTTKMTKPKMILHIVEVVDQVQAHIPGMLRCRLPDEGTTTIVSTEAPSSSPPFPFGPVQRYVRVLIPPSKGGSSVVLEEDVDIWVWEPWDAVGVMEDEEIFLLHKYAMK